METKRVENWWVFIGGNWLRIEFLCLSDSIRALQRALIRGGGHGVQELRGLRAGHRQGQWGPNHHQVWDFLIQVLDLADFFFFKVDDYRGQYEPQDEWGGHCARRRPQHQAEVLCERQHRYFYPTIPPPYSLCLIYQFQCENIVEDQEEAILEMFATEGQDMDIELCSRRCKEQLISFWGSEFSFSGPKSAPLWSPLQRNTSSRRTSCRRNLAFLYNFAILSHNPALWSPLSCCIYVVCT